MNQIEQWAVQQNQMASTLGQAKATKVTMLCDQLSEAHDQLARLNQALTNLEDRLSPAMAPSNIPPSVLGLQPSNDPPLIDSAASILSQLRDLWFRVESITDRVRI